MYVMLKKFLDVFILYFVICLFFLSYCTSTNNKEDEISDVSIKPSTQICPKLPKCYNNSYPPFIGYDKASCIKTLNSFDESLLQQLLDASGDCEQYKSLLLDFQMSEGCKALKECLGEDIFNKKLGGSIESCIEQLKKEKISLELQQCIYSAYYKNNKDCDNVILCINLEVKDIGFDSNIISDTGEKACVTDTDVYNCESVCDKFHSCTGLYCPPEAGECTKDDCIRGCLDPVGAFTIDLMCCIAQSSCQEITNCY